MKSTLKTSNRRKFLKGSALLGASLVSTPLLSLASEAVDRTEEGLYMIGPMKGYSPRVGTLLSTMNMMRAWVINTVKDLNTEQLDFLIDEDANSIGAMLMHLAATERYYQLNTFEGIEWGEWDKKISKEWGVASSLGDEARKKIKGHEIGYYLSKLEEVRAVTKEEFAKRDDDWLMESESFFGNEPTNNHCKWFHVCEHESNHNGQMKFIKKRFPG